MQSFAKYSFLLDFRKHRWMSQLVTISGNIWAELYEWNSFYYNERAKI